MPTRMLADDQDSADAAIHNLTELPVRLAAACAELTASGTGKSLRPYAKHDCRQHRDRQSAEDRD